MKIMLYTNADGSDDPSQSIIKHQVLTFKGYKIEVDLLLNPELKGHSDGKINALLLDRFDKWPMHERTFYVRASFIQMQRLRWMYKVHHFQVHQAIYIPVFAGLLGIILSKLLGVF